MYHIANITLAPPYVSAQLYTLVTFTCTSESTEHALEWTIQSHSLTDSSNQGRDVSVTTNNVTVDKLSSVLTIRALPINDGIIVGCIVVDTSLNIISKGANLKVEG